jgi:PAS domain S-box-containing protein
MTRSFDDSTVFRSLFAAYPDALLLVDLQGTIVLANPVAAQLLGYQPGQLVGLAVDALVPDAIRPRHATHRDAYRRNPRPRPMGTQMDLVAKRRDGSEVVVEIALSPLPDLPYVVAAIRDIGSYPRVKRALQRARYAEHLAQIGHLAVNARDAADLLRAVPLAAVEALQVEVVQVHTLDADTQTLRLAAGFGSAAPEAAAPDQPYSLPAAVLARGGPITVGDYGLEAGFERASMRPDPAAVSAIGVPIADRGRTVGVLSAYARTAERFGADETRFVESLANLLATVLQRSQSEDALRHAQGLEAVGQLTGGIAHDFNNLLTVISGNLQVLSEHPAVEADAASQQLVRAALRAVGRGAELTSKLLAFSRRQVLQPSRIDVAAMLGSLANMLRRTLDQRILIEVAIDADCPDCVADPGQLEAALLNIAINGRDAMAHGGSLAFLARRCGELPPALAAELAGAESAGPHDLVEIAVRDTGCGMSDAVKERAFEPFFTTKELGRGTGLGLSTVYGFVRQSNGGVSIDSAPGRGTTVALFIPAARNDRAGATGPPVRETGLPRGLRVLVVEDEPDVLQIVQHFLSSWRCDVKVCSRAEDALAMLQSSTQAFDLLLTDIVLGAGMRGTELALRAREARPALATLLMSGYSRELLKEQEPGSEAPELLRKPFSRPELAAAIAKALAAAGGRD